MSSNPTSQLNDSDNVPAGNVYRNDFAFHRKMESYLLMESQFQIYVYGEGEPPIFHSGVCKDIYSMEGFFLNFTVLDTHYQTHNPDEAHIYFLPFSVVMILEHFFDPVVRDKAVLQRVLVDYAYAISHKYPYWNRSLGNDHFMLSCHDWGPRATWYVPQLYYNSIRVLCNASTSEHLNPRKDASFPEINLKTEEVKGLTGRLAPSNRTVLAFFAGAAHGRMRPYLLQHWKKKDEDVRVYEMLPDRISYLEMLRKSKYCLCPTGQEVASPRIAEAIYAECVPVLISQHYILPFSDVLSWDSFSIQVAVSEIPTGVPQEEYLRMQKRVKQVPRHLLVSIPPKRYDVYNMIVHSVWPRRLNLGIGTSNPEKSGETKAI